MNKVLYRNDNCFGSGIRDIFEVVQYEMTSLWNTDVFKYCLKRYPLSETLSRTLLQDVSVISQYGERPNELDKDIRNLISELSALTGKQLRYALWLAEKNAVKTLYNGTDENISCYAVSDIILSDLGSDGCLFAYEQSPQPVNLP